MALCSLILPQQLRVLPADPPSPDIPVATDQRNAAGANQSDGGERQAGLRQDRGGPPASALPQQSRARERSRRIRNRNRPGRTAKTGTTRTGLSPATLRPPVSVPQITALCQKTQSGSQDYGTFCAQLMPIKHLTIPDVQKTIRPHCRQESGLIVLFFPNSICFRDPKKEGVKKVCYTSSVCQTGLILKGRSFPVPTLSGWIRTDGGFGWIRNRWKDPPFLPTAFWSASGSVPKKNGYIRKKVLLPIQDDVKSPQRND